MKPNGIDDEEDQAGGEIGDRVCFHGVSFPFGYEPQSALDHDRQDLRCLSCRSATVRSTSYSSRRSGSRSTGLAACPCVGDIDLTPGEAETLVSIARGSHQCLHTRDLVNLNLFRLIMTRGTTTFEATPLGQAWSRRHTEAPTSSSCVATPAARPLGRWKMWAGRWPPIGGARPRPSPSAGGGDRANAEVGEAPRRFSILAKEARQFEVRSRRTPGRSSVPGSTNRPPFQAGS